MLGRKLPYYFVVDVSQSMSDSALSEISNAIDGWLAESHGDPQCLETNALTLVEFSAIPRVVIPQTAVEDLKRTDIPQFVRQTTGQDRDDTNLRRTIEFLDSLIKAEVDIGGLDRKGDYKAIVYIFTDLKVAPDWEEAAAKCQSGHVSEFHIFRCGAKASDEDQCLIVDFSRFVDFRPGLKWTS